MHRIVTLTLNPSIDKNATVDYVVGERKLRCENFTEEPGGGGINVSRAIRNLGGQSLAIFPSGGYTGRRFESLLQTEDVEFRAVETQAETRENFGILETATNRQFRFNMPGPWIGETACEEILGMIEAMKPAPEYIVASGSLPLGPPPDFYGKVADLARRLGARCIIDTSRDALRLALEMDGVFLIKPNIQELNDLAGAEGFEDGHIEESATKLIHANKTQAVVVSLGAGGAQLISGEGPPRRYRVPTIPIRSRIGAGDSMVGGITLALTRGSSLEDAVRFGVAAGAAAVMNHGGELCKREDAERLYGQIAME